MGEELKTYKADGTVYDIPPEKEESFLTKYPKAEELRSFVVDKDTFDIPVNKEASFLSKYPDAVPTFGIKKKDGPSPSPEPPSTSPLENELADAIGSGDIERSPFLKELSNKSPWAAAPINNLVGAVGGSGPIMKAFDGAQKLFYKGVGSLMEMSNNPSVQAKGSALKADQDANKTWFKKAEEGLIKFEEEKLPPKIGAEGSPYKKDIFSDLLYTIGEIEPFMATLLVTPNPAIAGVGQKLTLNFAASNALQTYSDTGKALPSFMAAGQGVADGLAFQTLGLFGGAVGKGTAKFASNIMGQKASSILGSSSTAGAMFTGGYAHSIATQIINNPNWEYDDAAKEQALNSGMLFGALSSPQIVAAATSVYHQAPKSAIEAARKVEADPKDLRRKANELMGDLTKESSGQDVAEKSLAASMSIKTAELKSIDKLLGEHPEEALKKVKEMDISDAEKQSLVSKIEDAALNAEYQKQLELTKDLATAGDKLKAEKPVEAPKKPVETRSTPSGGKAPLEGESAEKGLKKPSVKTEEVDLTGEKTKKIQDQIDIEEDAFIKHLMKERGISEDEAERIYATNDTRKIESSYANKNKLADLTEQRIALEENTFKTFVSSLDKAAKEAGLTDAELNAVKGELSIKGDKYMGGEYMSLEEMFSKKNIEAIMKSVTRRGIEDKGLDPDGVLGRDSGWGEAEKKQYLNDVKDKVLSMIDGIKSDLSKQLKTEKDGLQEQAKAKEAAKAEEVREIPMAVEEGAEAEMGEKPSSIEQAMRNRPEDAPVPEAETMPKDMKGTWLDRYFKARGIIPKPVFRSYVKSKGANTASMYEIERVQREFKRNLKKEYGKTALGRPKVEPETMAKMNDALSNMGEGGTGWETLKELPVSIQESLIEMRANVDALSREMVRAGIVEGDLVAKFEENMGFYLTRTYRAHNDKKWTAKKIPEEVRNRAINFLRSEYPEFTEKQIDARLNAWLLEQDGPIGYIKNGPMGSKDLSILKGRKDIPIELRDFLGEYNDPLYNYASSVYRMTDLIAKDRFLKETLEIGDGKFLFDEPMGEFVKQIAAEGSKAMSPLNGKYTTPELAKAFENFENPRHFSSWFGQGYMAINSAVKYGKTILSPQTHIRNYVSNYMFHVANGRIFSGKGKGKDLFRFDYKNNKDPKYQEHISRLIELGVLKDNARAGEIFDSIRDSYKDFNDLDKSTDTFFKKPLKKTGKAFTELYQIEDDVHKLYSFGVEYNRYEGVMRKKFPEASEAEIKTMTEEKAADVVRNTMPTYSLVPEAMKQIRKLPIMGTFISFPAEVIRTTWNVMELATMEMKDPHTRQIGIGRMTGLLTAAVATSAASYGSKFLVGMNNSDDDDLRRFMPSWSENSDLVFVKQPKDGKYTYIDLGYSDPFNYIKKGVNAYLNNQENPGEGINSMVTEMLEPFIGEELLASKILDVQRNSKKETGTQIYNPTDTWGGQAAEKLLYMWDGVKPGIISSADRIAKGAKKKVEGSREYDLAEEVVAVGLGQRVAKINVGESFMFKTKGYASDISDAKFLYNKVRYSKSPDINEKQLGKAYDNANASLEKIIMEAHEDYKAALRLGVSKRELKTHIINNMGGSGKMAQGMIVKGRFVPINRKTGGW